MDFGIASFAGISVLCFLATEWVKASAVDSKWLPAISGAIGAVLGVAALYMGVPDFPALDPMTAAAVGTMSGLAATGAHQIYKQQTK